MAVVLTYPLIVNPITLEDFVDNLGNHSATQQGLVFSSLNTYWLRLYLYVDSTLLGYQDYPKGAFYSSGPKFNFSPYLPAIYASQPNATTANIAFVLKKYTTSAYTTEAEDSIFYGYYANFDPTINKPTFTDYSIASVDKALNNVDSYGNTLVSTTTNTLTGSNQKIIKGYSDVRASITTANKMVAKNSATAVSYAFTNGTQNSSGAYSSGSTVNIDITNATAIANSVSAIDSRSFSTAVSKSFSVLAEYEALSVSPMTIVRDNQIDKTVTLTLSGTFWKKYFGSNSTTSSGVLNTLTCEYRYKESTVAWGSQTWTALTPSTTSGIIVFSGHINGDLGALGFDQDKSYNVQVRFYDQITNTIIEGTISKGIPLMDLTTHGVAIKKKYNTTIGGSFQVDEEMFTPASVRENLSSGYRRNAVMNSNSDVWQRATTYGDMSHGNIRTMDRFKSLCVINNVASSATGSVTQSQQVLTAGDIPYGYYYHRTNFTSAVAMTANANDYIGYSHSVLNGVKYLCGNGKTVTVSFWFKSSIAGKKIGIYLRQVYGTGGSPTATETINGSFVATTTAWAKYTVTFTTNTLSGKTFGTNNDDYIDIRILYGWGSGTATNVGDSATNSMAIGTYDIDQLTLNEGSIAYPFMPRSYQQELDDCQRICYVINPTNSTTNINETFGVGSIAGTTIAYIFVPFPVHMRTIPPIFVSSASHFRISDFSAAYTCTSISLIGGSQNSNKGATIAMAASGMTAGKVGVAQINNASAQMIFDVEP